MTTIELYRKHKAGEIGRDRFLYEVRRDKNLPWVTNVTSYDDAVKILKNKGVISEAGLDVKLESNSLNEDSLQDILEPLKDRLESIGYEQVGFDNQFGHPRFEGFKSLPDGSKLRIGLSPSEEELQQKKYTGTADQFSTVDISFTHWTKDGVATKLSDEDGIKLDKESVEKIILMVKNAEQKASQKEGSLNEAKGSNNDDVAINARAYRDQMKIDAEIKKLRKLNESDVNIATDPAVDRVNPYFLKKGVEKMLSKEEELTNDSYINALNKAAKQLQKNPHAFDKEMFANAEDVEKADAKLETQEVKKANHKDKANEMKKAKVKALKEAAITELKDYLKKKEQINEDSHYKHHVGSEVHTPDGKGKVVEIVGGTLTVEMEDGSHKDFQINTIDHFTQKASEEEPVQQPQTDPSVKDMWANWKGNTFGGMVGDPEHFKKPLDLSKIKQYMEMYKHDKDKMSKLKEVLKKLKETKALVVPRTATGQQIDKMIQADPTIKTGQQIDILRK